MVDHNIAINNYLKEIEGALQSGDSTEHTHRPALKALIEALEPTLTATNEPRRAACGAPDFVISKKSKHGSLSIGYIEAKDIDKSLDETLKTDQIKRYLAALPNLVVTDYIEFRWFLNRKQVGKARLGATAPKGRIQITPSGIDSVLRILKGFLSQSPEKIGRAKELAIRLANLTQIIRDIIIKSFEEKTVSKTMRSLFAVFSRTLIADLDEPKFADMFAQTLAYGLFAARCFYNDTRDFTSDKARHFIPRSTPFLRDYFDEVTGTNLDYEPFADVVDELVQLLRMTDMESVMEDFGKGGALKDPIFHFYETFLNAYDPSERKQRGVYYTPEPVVSYIVRSVDHILKTHFDLSRGFADHSKIRGKSDFKSHKVLILDPACGTGTFLYHVIDFIRKQFKKSRKMGMWQSYVHEHLLPRLFGFELQMAPYVIAHLKLAMELTGRDQLDLFTKGITYEFKADERINVFLTSTLETAEQKVQENLYGYNFIAEEANAAIEVKTDLPILVVMGNPPYSGISANMGDWIIGLLKGKLPNGEKVPSYYEIDGEALGEKKVWLQDDYVKFIRWGQWRIETTGAGVLAFVTNNGYIDNPTFRGMRQQLMRAFDEIYILDLHGNSKKKEMSPDGTRDQNVFDIQQGVAIGIFIKKAGSGQKAQATIYHAGLWGTRDHKYEKLSELDINTVKWEKLNPQSPYYLFVPQKSKKRNTEYSKWWRITDIMPVNVTGIVTARDDFVIGFDRKPILDRINKFLDPDLSDFDVKQKLRLNENYSWRVADARKALKENIKGIQSLESFITPILYRPFDQRLIFYQPDVVWRTRYKIMRHMLAGSNLALITTRQTREKWDSLVTNIITGHKTCAAYDINSLFPLYLYPDPNTNGHLFTNGTEKHINLNPEFISDIEKRLKLKFFPDIKGNLKSTIGPEDIFNYIYAIFHSPAYRVRYAESLKVDFPRVPITSNARLFRSLCLKGSALVALHLMESPVQSNAEETFPESGSDTVETGYPQFIEIARRVYINKEQYFDNIPEHVWNFHIGGYQICEKWIKDRRGRKLSHDDIDYYQKIVVAIHETIRIMKEIDEIIPSWPIT